MNNVCLVDERTDQRRELLDVSVFGRAPDCSIQILDPKVSRRHAMIRRQEHSLWFYDLGSVNGSYINGRRVVTATKLQEGDRIRISEVTFSFHGMDSVAESLAAGMPQTIPNVETAPLVMLVSDVKNFSSIAEAFPPDKLAQTMGLWYRECNAILPMRGATIDKFIGDAVLAYWPDVDVASKAQALRAARDIVQVCESIQARHATVFAEHALSLGVGVAINQGVVAHGGMGAGAFTLLGEAVNATFRIEGLTRKLNGDVVVTEEFLRDWDEGRTFCVPAGTFEVKGHSNAVAVHIVQSFPDG